MAEEDLINLKDRSLNERRKIAKLGGLVKSENKRIANTIKNLKHGNYASKFTLMINDLAKSPDKSALRIFELIERIGLDWDNLNPKIQIQLARLYCTAHATVHGTKQLNLNVNQEIKQDIERWFTDETDK